MLPGVTLLSRISSASAEWNPLEMRPDPWQRAQSPLDLKHNLTPGVLTRHGQYKGQSPQDESELVVPQKRLDFFFFKCTRVQ